MSGVYVCMLRGVWGHAPPRNFLKFDALRLLLTPFRDRSKAVVVIHGSRSIVSNFCLSTYAFAKPADFEFP